MTGQKVGKASGHPALSVRLLLILTLLCIASAAMAAPVPITVWFYPTNMAVAEWIEKYNDQFNAENPDIALDFRVMPWDAVRTTVVVASAAGTGPDICYISANLVPMRIAEGMTLPLNRYLDAYPERQDFLPEVLASLSDSRGQVHAMPYAMWGVFDLYNTRVLDQNGVGMPDDWNSLIRAVRKMTTYASDGTVMTYGFADAYSTTTAVYSLHMAMEQLGKGIISMGDARADLHNDRGIRALNFLQELWQSGMPNNNLTAKFPDIQAGRMAIYGYGCYNIHQLERDSASYIEPRRSVGPAPGQDIVRFNCPVLYILSTSKHPDEAWRVLSDFLSPRNSEQYLAVQQDYLPVRRSLFRKIGTISTHPLTSKVANIMYSPMTTYGPVHSYWHGEIQTGVGNIMLQVLQGKRPVSGSLEEAERLANTALAQVNAAK
jgi:ABC-type glycerol-3-phosphate transport system substrate-binding protein